MGIRKEFVSRYGPYAAALVVGYMLVALSLKYEVIKPFLDMTIYGLTIASLVFAARAFHDTLKIKHSLSTQYAGEFPRHVNEIAEVVQAAHSSIEIFTDCVDYGSITPELHRYLFSSILSALGRPSGTLTSRLLYRLGFLHKRVRVTFLVWGKPKTISSANRLGGPTARTNGDFSKAMRLFCDDLPRHQPHFVESFPSQFQALRLLADNPDTNWNGAAEQQTLTNLLVELHTWEANWLTTAGATISGQYYNGPASTIPRDASPPDFLFWIRDRQEAVLLFPCPDEDALAFRTQDRVLVRRLVDIFAQKYQAATGAEFR